MLARRVKTSLLHCEIFILAGGLSTRMGRDKSRAPLGQRTMLEQVRTVAKQTGLRARVIRRDAVARCGPLGGIYTGLKRSRTEYVMFLACDMPFVTVELLRRMLKAVGARTAVSAHSRKETNRGQGCPRSFSATFAQAKNRAGFPSLLHRESALPIVLAQIKAAEHSMQSLAKKLRAKIIRAGSRELANINTPEELKRAASRFLRHDHNIRLV